MVQLIVGNKGKGKTKYLLDKANEEIKSTTGNIVYLDKSTKHMFELNNKIRLIDVTDYLLDSTDAFVGFISGILSQDNDLASMYLDSFLKIACAEESQIYPTIEKLEKISDKYHVNFVISISVDEVNLDERLKSRIIESL